MTFNNINTPQKLLAFMNENIKYGYVDKNGKIYDNPNQEEWKKFDTSCYVQTGEGILETKVGTCWDQVELERLWFENNAYNFKTIFIWFEVNYENNYPTHTFLIFEKNKKWYWFENAFEAYKGIHEFDTYQNAIKCVINKHSEYAVQNNFTIPNDKKHIKAYEYTKLNKRISTDMFLKHVTKKRI